MFFSRDCCFNRIGPRALQDGEVSVDEFKKGIELSCKGKSYSQFPAAFRFFIDSCFRTIDVDGKNGMKNRKKKIMTPDIERILFHLPWKRLKHDIT